MKRFRILHTLVSYRELIRELAVREIKARYKQSILGYAWVMLNPLFQMIVMAFVFSTLLRVPVEGTSYPLFLYVGLLPWILFTGSLQSSTGVLVDNSSLIKKIYFPREIFVVSTLLAKLADFFLASSLLVIFFIFFKQPIVPTLILFLPILLIQELFTYGLSLILAASNLLYRDIQYVLTLVLMIWLYMTPVMYPPQIIPQRFSFIFEFNPMAQFIMAYRQVVLFGQLPSLLTISLMVFVAVVTVGIGYVFFKKVEGLFADIV